MRFVMQVQLKQPICWTWTLKLLPMEYTLPAPLLKLVYKIKGADKTALITDAIRAAGMPEGDSVLGPLNTGLKVIVEDGVAKLPDRSSFAGSSATFDRLVRNMVQMADVSLLDCG
jgi:N-acetylglucosamine-6-phosphate deacetylase